MAIKSQLFMLSIIVISSNMAMAMHHSNSQNQLETVPVDDYVLDDIVVPFQELEIQEAISCGEFKKFQEAYATCNQTNQTKLLKVLKGMIEGMNLEEKNRLLPKVLREKNDDAAYILLQHGATSQDTPKHLHLVQLLEEIIQHWHKASQRANWADMIRDQDEKYHTVREVFASEVPVRNIKDHTGKNIVQRFEQHSVDTEFLTNQSNEDRTTWKHCYQDRRAQLLRLLKLIQLRIDPSLLQDNVASAQHQQLNATGQHQDVVDCEGNTLDAYDQSILSERAGIEKT
jgi:hypothetical protein